MAIIRETTGNKCWQGSGEKGSLVCCFNYKLVQPLWRTAWRFLKKLKIELPYDPAILLGYISKKNKNKNSNSMRYLHPNVIAVLFTIAKIWKQSECSSADE